MMLGTNEIIKQQSKNNIYIDPFELSQLGPNSYDVRMGEWVVEEVESSTILFLDEELQTNKIWQEPRFISGNFIVAPGAFFLTHTMETIGSHKYATLLKARSTIARVGLDICASAGFGDVGYVNKWTLEIKNNSKNHIELKPGMRLAQISFQEVKGYTQYQGAYKQNYVQKYTDGESYQIEWKPEDMLPKLGPGRF